MNDATTTTPEGRSFERQVGRSEWIKPTTKTPPPGEIVWVRNKKGTAMTLGYLSAKGWTLHNFGLVDLSAVHEWAHFIMKPNAEVDRASGSGRTQS